MRQLTIEMEAGRSAHSIHVYVDKEATVWLEGTSLLMALRRAGIGPKPGYLPATGWEVLLRNLEGLIERARADR